MNLWHFCFSRSLLSAHDFRKLRPSSKDVETQISQRLICLHKAGFLRVGARLVGRACNQHSGW
jgi:hypothetical protein